MTALQRETLAMLPITVLELAERRFCSQSSAWKALAALVRWGYAKRRTETRTRGGKEYATKVYVLTEQGHAELAG